MHFEVRVVLMRALGFQVKKQDVVKFVHEIDPQNEGMVNFEQFMDLMTDRYAGCCRHRPLTTTCSEFLWRRQSHPRPLCRLRQHCRCHQQHSRRRAPRG